MCFDVSGTRELDGFLGAGDDVRLAELGYVDTLRTMWVNFPEGIQIMLALSIISWILR